MKKQTIFLILLVMGISSKAQLLLTENFNYNTGNLTNVSGRNNVSGGVWRGQTIGSTLIGAQTVTNGSLTYPKYNSPLNTNKLSLLPDSTGEISLITFSPENKGTIYFSFLIKINNIEDVLNRPRYFIRIMNDAAQGPDLRIKKGLTDSTFKLVIKDNCITGGIEIETDSNYKFGDTKLVVLAYNFDSNTFSLWVNPNTLTKPTATLEIKNSNCSYSEIYRFDIDNKSSSVNYRFNCDFDALHIGKTWEDIMGVPEYSIEQINTSNAITGIADSIGLKVKVKGVVHRYNQTTAGLKFLLHNGTSGITAVSPTKTFGYTVGEGDNVEVTGVVNSQRGLVILNIDTLILLSQFNATSIPIIADKLGENTENKLVTITKLKFINKPANTWSAGTFNTITQNTNDTVPIVILPNSLLVGKKAPTNNWFNVIGIGTQESSSLTSPFAFNGYGIILMKLSDIVFGDSITNIDELNTADKISFYPNPVTNQLTINLKNQMACDFAVNLYNNNGILVKKLLMKNVGNLEINVSDLKAGLYLIEILNDGKRYVSRLIKE
jgi:hypothetical protein